MVKGHAVKTMQRNRSWLCSILFVTIVGSLIQTNLLLHLRCNNEDMHRLVSLENDQPLTTKMNFYTYDEEETKESALAMQRRTSLVDDLTLQPLQGCRTSFHRASLPAEEQHFLLFSAPPPNLDAVPESLLQWQLILDGKGTLVVFVNQNQRIYETQGIPTVCVEHTDEGLPRFDQMLRRMHELQESGGIVAFVNSDVWINQTSFEALHNFLIDMEDASFDVVKTSLIFKEFQRTEERTPYWFTVLTRIDIDAEGLATRHTAGGYDFWAWNVGLPEFPLKVPPFRYPFAAYDGWLLDMMTQASGVATIDASNVAELIHYEHKRVGNSTTWYQALQQGVTGIYFNKHLSYTTVINKMKHYWTFGTPLETPYFVEKNEDGNLDIMPRKYWSNIDEKILLETTDCASTRCEKTTSVTKRTIETRKSVQSLPILDQRQSGGQLWKSVSTNWRYVIDKQLAEHNRNGTVILTGATYAYRDHLRNFKCNMERVGASNHWIVAALDTDIYKWGIYQGFPIFLAATSTSEEVVKPSKRKRQPRSYATKKDSDYGSQGFRIVTKLKSATVLQVLELGYSVVWSDLDIAWFDDPLATLQDYLARGELGIQSNAPYVQTGDITQPHPTVDRVKSDDPAAYRRLNSGLYAAPNTPIVRQAFREIVRHAKNTDKTEQPSFDEILCNTNGSRRYKTHCVYARDGESLLVRLLNRFQFANGAVLVSAGNKNVFDLGKEFEFHTGVPLVAAHNNWIRGNENKLERHRAAGWWYAKDDESCLYPGDIAIRVIEPPDSSDYQTTVMIT